MFIAIGVFSGLVFGVYLIDLKNTSQLVFVDGPSISIVTDKTDFKKGEEIKIRIINSGTVPLHFEDTSFGLRITGLSGVLMYSPNPTPSFSILEPEEEIEFLWNQIKNDGDSAIEGLYKISAQGSDLNGNLVKKSTTVTIWK